eukprot:2662254-Lingulodinium_polyedra.AAC.1
MAGNCLEHQHAVACIWGRASLEEKGTSDEEDRVKNDANELAFRFQKDLGIVADLGIADDLHEE